MQVKVLDISDKNNVMYRLDDNDTFENLSKQFQVPIEYIKLFNGPEIYKGKVIFLPEINLQTYIVKPFDTLEKIANIFGKSADDIKQKNILTSSYIFVGQKLFI